MDNNNRVRRRRKQQRRSMITNIVMCLITLSALTACIVLVLKNYDLKRHSLRALKRNLSIIFILRQILIPTWKKQEQMHRKQEKMRSCLS